MECTTIQSTARSTMFKTDFAQVMMIPLNLHPFRAIFFFQKETYTVLNLAS